ncbi:hypothetical protein PHMEG_00010386 [Phytophthora megakarya]|uniref:Uncharacterized protein n=1 Tax=Phytophthora megakarya TaxID=4795 RepID=A0A225WDV1_9STRA|nr:hypothetical protein PHMEG_00010386 [Phytophthora megakarya]
MVQDVDHLISLHRATTDGPGSSVQLVSRRGAESTVKTQFQPSGMQTSIHLTLVNGKYASMTAQRFVEYVQVSWRKFGFLPHPAVLRGLFCWDFGTRGLSILHFSRVTELEKRSQVRKSDMSNFSKKNTLPVAPDATSFSVIFGAVEVLCNVTRHLYQPVVHATLDAAAAFLMELRVTELPTSTEALAEVTAWIDDRLELFRVYVADDDWQQASTIKSHFSASHESFVRVHQLIVRQDIISAVRTAKTTLVRSDRPNLGSEANKRVSIPVDVRNALPKQGKKEICLRFLSRQGCKGKNGNCLIKTLCHFKPATLPDIVREFVEKNYGGVSVDMK